jgi:hypothetical protein
MLTWTFFGHDETLSEKFNKSYLREKMYELLRLYIPARVSEVE